MRKMRTFAFAIVALTASLLLGCGFGPGGETGGLTGADSGAARAVISDGNSFVPGHNPFIHNSNLGRNASDPAGVWAPTPQGYKLLMVTSSDLVASVPTPGYNNYYPMDKTYLYVLDPNNSGNNTWHDFGAILEESDVPWATHAEDHVWAPDIDYLNIRGSFTYYAFVPMRDSTTGKQKIAVFDRAVDPFGDFDYVDYLHIYGAPDSGTNADPYAYDPGVFHLYEGGTAPERYLTYVDAEYNSSDPSQGDMHIAKFDGTSATEADYIGEIVIDGIPGDLYTEGPDLVRVRSESIGGEDSIYLIFARKQELGEQEYIGYARKTLSQFEANPATGWQFGGWIQTEIDPVLDGTAPTPSGYEWTNHATIVPAQRADGTWKYYYLYQFSQGDNSPADGQMRQISMREIRIDGNRWIQGVSYGDPQVESNYLEHQPLYPYDGISFSAATADETRDETNRVQPRFFINNETTQDIDRPTQAFYFFERENGKTPVIDDYWTPSWDLALRQFGGNVWAVQMTYAAAPQDAGFFPYRNIPSSGDGETFALRYSDWSNFDKSNDFSQPYGVGYTDTDKIPVFDVNGDLRLGINPRIVIESAWTTFSGRTLTSSTELVGGENLVVGMPYDAGWNTQEWQIEPIPNSQYVRIKDTGTGKYLNVNSLDEGHYVTVQNKNHGWWSMQWTIVPSSVPGYVQFLNRWTGKLLTRGNPNNPAGGSSWDGHDRDDYITVWSQGYVEGWESQRWSLEFKN